MYPSHPLTEAERICLDRLYDMMNDGWTSTYPKITVMRLKHETAEEFSARVFKKGTFIQDHYPIHVKYLQITPNTLQMVLKVNPSVFSHRC